MTAASARHPVAPKPLSVAVVDNHAHLDMARYGEEGMPVAEALAAARAVGVDRVLHVACDVESIERLPELLAAHPELLAAAALHPNDAAQLAAAGRLHAAYEVVEVALREPRVRAVGETGLDYFRTDEAGRPAQEESFRWHIDLAKRTGRALQIHDRDAHDDVLRVLAEEGAPERTVLHCFSGDVAMAREAVARGYYLSYAGTVTFKNAAGLREALAVTPLERVLVETDAPYLAPHPWRGATNASWLLPVTVRAIAEVLGRDVDEVCAVVSATSEQIYGHWPETVDAQVTDGVLGL